MSDSKAGRWVKLSEASIPEPEDGQVLLVKSRKELVDWGHFAIVYIGTIGCWHHERSDEFLRASELSRELGGIPGTQWFIVPAAPEEGE